VLAQNAARHLSTSTALAGVHCHPQNLRGILLGVCQVALSFPHLNADAEELLSRLRYHTNKCYSPDSERIEW